MAIAASTIIGDALGLINVVDPMEAIAAEDAALGLRTLNRLVNMLAADSLMPVAVAFQPVPLTAAGGTKTIGAAGDIVVTKPTKIEVGAYILSGTTSYPLHRLTREQWAKIPYKTQQGLPNCYWYEPTTAILGTVNFWPVPSSSCTAYLPLKSSLTAFANLTTEYSLPEGYEEYLLTALAVHSAPLYQRQASGDIAFRMKQAKKLIKRLNVRVPQLSTPELCALSRHHHGTTSSQAIMGDEVDIY